MNDEVLTVGQIADRISAVEHCTVPPWKVARLFEQRLLPDPVRFKGRRAIAASAIPLITELLRRRGALPSVGPASV